MVRDPCIFYTKEPFPQPHAGEQYTVSSRISLSLTDMLLRCRYIEACESGSMFEGLLDNDLDIYVTTAANAIESSWATYCPTFFFQSSSPSQRSMMHSGRALAGSSSGSGDEVLAYSQGLDDDSIVKAAQAVLGSVPATAALAAAHGVTSSPEQLGFQGVGVEAPAAAAPAAAGGGLAVVGAVNGGVGMVEGIAAGGDNDDGGDKPEPPPELYVCLGDLYSVAWMENSEEEDLTKETLLQQYKLVKVSTLGSGGRWGWWDMGSGVRREVVSGGGGGGGGGGILGRGPCVIHDEVALKLKKGGWSGGVGVIVCCGRTTGEAENGQ